MSRWVQGSDGTVTIRRVGEVVTVPAGPVHAVTLASRRAACAGTVPREVFPHLPWPPTASLACTRCQIETGIEG